YEVDGITGFSRFVNNAPILVQAVVVGKFPDVPLLWLMNPSAVAQCALLLVAKPVKVRTAEISPRQSGRIEIVEGREVEKLRPEEKAHKPQGSEDGEKPGSDWNSGRLPLRVNPIFTVICCVY